jgi:putative nucleotidyltransferase with HDIG domain
MSLLLPSAAARLVKPAQSLLIVDDEPAVRNLMVKWAESLGLTPRTAATAEEAVQVISNERCDLAVIDVMMPGRNGLWLIDKLRHEHPETALILATGFVEQLDVQPVVADLLIKPFKRDRFILALDRGREWRRHAVEEIEWHARLCGDMDARLAEAEHLIQAAAQAGLDEAGALSRLADSRIPDVVEHAERVARYTQSIARELGLDEARIARFELAARFHDIGKAVTPEAVLTKPSPLTASEAHIMRRHVEAGAAILLATETLVDLAPIVRASHEWYGGTGYPDRLAGVAIPLASRIIAVADAYDAMTQDRQYRTRLDAVEAISELLRCTPNQFDPDVVIAFLNILGRH